MTLFPEDIIATGTPSGVGQLETGDKVEVEIEGIGILIILHFRRKRMINHFNLDHLQQKIDLYFLIVIDLEK